MIVAKTGREAVEKALNENFDVLKGRMGLNNYQVEEERLSLRRELFRLPEDAAYDALWRQMRERSLANARRYSYEARRERLRELLASLNLLPQSATSEAVAGTR